MCLWAGVARPTRRERRAWLVIGAGVAAWTFGEIYYTAVLWTAEEIPIPSPADAGYLLFPPLMLVGVLMLLRSRTRDVPGTLWADGVTAALAVSAASAALVFETVRDSASGQAMEIAVSLAYPIADLVLLGLIVGALAGTGWQLDRTWVLLAGGVASFWLADSLYLVRTAAGTYESGQLVRDRLVARPGPDRRRVLAARAPHPAAARSTSGCGGSSSRSASARAGSACSSTAAIAGLNTVAIALAAASLLAVMCRTMLTFRDNVAMLRTSRVEATTDALTGLGNRRALARALAQRAAARGATKDPLVLVLFDLDGFKHYNDTFGHPAGDALLVRLGAGLARFVAGRGTAFRMGGDEFCALLRAGTPLGHAARRRRGRRALRARRGLRDRLLLRRDPPARRGGRRRRGAADRRPAHVRAEERRPHVGHAPVQGRAAARARRAQPRRRATTTSATADLAEATARQLGLGVEEVEQIRHADRAARRRQGRDAGRDPDQARAARRRRVGLHPPPHDHRRADHRRRAGARPASPRSCAPATSAGTATGYPDALAGERDPARRPHRRGGRRLRRR